MWEHENINSFAVYQQDSIRNFNGIWDLIKCGKNNDKIPGNMLSKYSVSW